MEDLQTDVQTVEIDSQYPVAPTSFLIGYDNKLAYVARPLSTGGYTAKFLVPTSASLLSAVVASQQAVYGGTFSDPTKPNVVPFPSAFSVVPFTTYAGTASLGAYAATIDVFGMARAALGFLASIPRDIAAAAQTLETGLAQLGQNLWSGLTSAGMAVAGAVKSALDWSMKTKINIGPFSISVFDLTMLVVGAVVPFAAVGLVAGFAADALVALGLDAATASVLGRIAGGLAGGALAYAIGKLSGESDAYALLDAALAAVSPFVGWKGLLALAVGGPLILSAVSPQSVQSLSADNTKGDLAMGSAVVKSCFDPYSSVLPMADCMQALSASGTPLAAFVYIGPEVAPGVLAAQAMAQVKNVSGVQGTFTVKVVNNGR
ncbi:MAG: hypothetical protein ACP5MH_12225, partial [Thermoproteus sp.]